MNRDYVNRASRNLGHHLDSADPTFVSLGQIAMTSTSISVAGVWWFGVGLIRTLG